ncbi:right-handed parallel beta-helix repeat-containing protein [Pseudarthrobacter quantipunctorum]|uniref:Right-handed parallel beta-helix repeat-containing protein n=1 Tax=Pseudarthrobacter quantipunctorum TaxID=3128980 RepID=A0ABZ2R9A2_9MICC
MQPALRPLSRRTLLKGAGAAVVGSALFTDEHTPPGGGSTTRYVSVFGSDSGPGTEAAPWHSLARVRAALREGELRRGDAVLLKRGDTFFGTLHEPSIQGTAGVFTVGAYGTGPRPKVSGYKISKAAWTQHAKGIWKLDITARSGQYRGNTAAPSTNVGFLKVAGLIRGGKRTSLEALENQWDFYSDEAFVYVSSSFAPGDGVAIAVQQDGFRPASHSILDGIHIEGHGAHGIATGGSENIRIRNCRLEDLGGSQLASDGTRYGNGVEVWIGASNIVIENSTIRECYDVAFTMQGTATKEAKAWTDIHFRNNRVENCNQTFEMWSAGEATPGSGHIRCMFNHNICVNAGYSWAATLRPDREGKGTHILTYDTELPMDVEVTRNQFIRARDSYLNISGDKKPPKGLNLHHNIIKLGPGTKTAYGSAETIELAARWQARTGKEHGSTFGVLSTDRCEAPA